MLIAAAVRLITAKVGAGGGDFGGSIDRIDGNDYERLNTGITFPDQGRGRLKMEIVATDGIVLPGVEAMVIGRQREIHELGGHLLDSRCAVVRVLCGRLIVPAGGQVGRGQRQIGGLGDSADRSEGEELVGDVQRVGILIVIAVGQVGGIGYGVVDYAVADLAVDGNIVVEGAFGTLFEIDGRSALAGYDLSAVVNERTVVHDDIRLRSAYCLAFIRGFLPVVGGTDEEIVSHGSDSATLYVHAVAAGATGFFEGIAEDMQFTGGNTDTVVRAAINPGIFHDEVAVDVLEQDIIRLGIALVDFFQGGDGIAFRVAGEIDMRPFEDHEGAVGATDEPAPETDVCGILGEGKAGRVVLGDTEDRHVNRLCLGAFAEQRTEDDHAGAIAEIERHTGLDHQGIAVIDIDIGVDRVGQALEHGAFDSACERNGVADCFSGGLCCPENVRFVC